MPRMMHVLRRAYFPSLIRQQVIVRSHRQKDDYGHRQYEPAQFDAENYCETSTESPNDAPSEKRHCTDANQGGDKTSRDDKHDDKNEAERSDSRNQEIVFRAVLRVLECRHSAGEVDLGVLQRRPLQRLLGRRLYRVDTRDPLGRRGMARSEMIVRTAFPSGDRNKFIARLKSGLSKASGGK